MEYSELAVVLLEQMQSLHRLKPYRSIIESMQGEPSVLEYIARHEGYVLPGEIAHEMNISSARVAAILNKLENKRFITRQVDTNNRRHRLVRITQDGKNLDEKHNQNLMGDAAKLIGFLGEHDAKEYIRITKRLAEIPSDYDDY